MKSDFDLPILVFPSGARCGLPSPPDVLIGGVTLYASGEPAGQSTARATGKKRGEAAEAAFLVRATYLGFSVFCSVS